MVRVLPLAFALMLAASTRSLAQPSATAVVTLSYPSQGGGASITQSQNGVSHSYQASLAPVLDGGKVSGVTVILREPGGPNLLSVTGEAAARSRFEAVDCLGDPPTGGLYGREREFNIPGHDAHVLVTLAACEATPDGENAASQIASMHLELRIERGARPRPP